MKWGILKRNDNNSVSYDPFSRNMKDFFDNFFSVEPFTPSETEWKPRVDIEENEKSIRIKAEMPGIDEKDLNVTLKDSQLTISGEKKEEKKENDKEGNYVYSERRYGSFYRTICLPEGIKADEIKAHYKNGILEIELPKEDAVQPKKIEITV